MTKLVFKSYLNTNIDNKKVIFKIKYKYTHFVLAYTVAKIMEQEILK